MATKMRVRDLSGELGITNKELLHLLREENIPVKSHMSGLTEEQVALIRDKFKNQASQAITEKKVSGGIIIRRKKRSVKKEEKVSPQGQVEGEEEKKKVLLEKKGAPEISPEEREEKGITEEIGEPSLQRGTLEKQEEQVSKEEDVSGEVEGVSEEKIPSRKEELKSEDKKGTKKRDKKERKYFKDRKKIKKKWKKPLPKVKVISHPPTPEEQPPSDKKEEVREISPEVKAPVEPKGPAGKKEKISRKRSKARKVVDVSSIYEEMDQRKQKLAWKKKKESHIEDKTGGKASSKKKKAIKEEHVDESPRVSTQPIKAAKRKIRIEEAIRVSELAQKMGIKAQEIIKTLMDLGVMATINQAIDYDTVSIVAAEFGYEVEKVGFSEDDYILPKEEDKPEDLRPRPPVVTIMGHVDHGKTTLLDAIRSSRIAEHEAGGITQHIGAYHVKLGKHSVVFLDTPGHEAFTEMRARGAQVTDIVVLIVAADDGVMDQTVEAINHAKAAGVPIIVAINKIDKENADPERVKRELADYGLIPEEWGGDTIFVNISAKNRLGLDQLLEMLLLQAEVLELKANPNKRARGHIIESKLDRGRGAVGTVLIKEGTLKTGDAFVCGLYHGKVRALFDDRGKKVGSAGPSMPVEVQGFDGVPNAGDEFVVVENEKVAKRIAETRQQKHREKELAKQTKLTLETFFKAKEQEKVRHLNLILKTDVHGSYEAISEALQKLSTDEVDVRIIHGSTGAINENDVKLASASHAIIIGFNVRPTSKVKELAEQEGVEIRFYSIIYELVNDIKEALAGLLTPIKKEVYLGQAEVRETFNIPKVGTVAGCFVVDGKIKRTANVRLLRDGVVVYTGKVSSLKRFKDDVKEVTKGYECGLGLENFNDIKKGDIIEAFEEIEERPTLD